ncbi:MAG TPA: hypothetical protein VFT84_16010 [Gemmatimonadales bacterium]|nr:hypothetical protein [Gemmatimonadales bacterium]
MRAVTSGVIALMLVGCSKPADKPADATVGEAPGAAAEAAPAGLNLADMAGTWKIRSTVEGTDKVVTYDMTTTGDQNGWSIKFPDREPIPVRVVAVEGDSVVSEAGPFESVLRKGVQVKTHVVSRLQDGKLVGTTVARYDVTGPDTVARLSFEGTRAP